MEKDSETVVVDCWRYNDIIGCNVIGHNVTFYSIYYIVYKVSFRNNNVLITLFLIYYCLYNSLILTGISFELQTIIALFQKSSLVYNYNDDDDNEDEK